MSGEKEPAGEPAEEGKEPGGPKAAGPEKPAKAPFEVPVAGVPFPFSKASPADFPRGYWRRVDYLLQHPAEIQESLRTGNGLPELMRIFFFLALGMGAIYGAVMGATNLLQGSPMALHHKLMLTGIVALKVPALFLLTLAIVMPPVYVSNIFLGSKLAFRQMCTLMLASLAITMTALASMATVALFFALTSGSYDFLKLLHVGIFVYAGLAGVGYLRRASESIGPNRSGGVPPQTFMLWLGLYAFVGMQLAWVMRPFISSPYEPFQVFRPRSGSFYESVLRSLGQFLGA